MMLKYLGSEFLIFSQKWPKYDPHIECAIPCCFHQTFDEPVWSHHRPVWSNIFWMFIWKKKCLSGCSLDVYENIKYLIKVYLTLQKYLANVYIESCLSNVWQKQLCGPFAHDPNYALYCFQLKCIMGNAQMIYYVSRRLVGWVSIQYIPSINSEKKNLVISLIL